MKEYEQRPEVKERHKAFIKTAKREEAINKYNHSAKGKTCRHKYRKKYDQTSQGKETKRKYQIKYYNSGKGKLIHQKNQLKRNYGISLEDFDNMLIQQNHKCAICGVSLVKIRRHIDHDHKKNIIRGILCHGCNTGIGLLKEDIEIFKKGINYLEKNKGGD